MWRRGPQGPRPDAAALSAAVYSERTESDQLGDNPHIFKTRERKAPVEVTGDHPGMLLKLGTKPMSSSWRRASSPRYVNEEIDAALYCPTTNQVGNRRSGWCGKLLPLMKIGIRRFRRCRAFRRREGARAKPHCRRASRLSL